MPDSDASKAMTAAQRHAEGVRYAGPDSSYPIRPGHPEDVRNAWDLAGHADDPEAVRARIREIAAELGMADALPETAKESGGKSIVAGEPLVYFGGELKSLGDGKVGGWAIVFSESPDEVDLTGDYFDGSTDLWLDDDGEGKAAVLFDHGLDEQIGPTRFGTASLKKMDRGLWFEAKLKEHAAYVDDVMKLVDAGVLGISTGSVSHLVRRQRTGKSSKITSWPVYEVSLTHRPAEPRTLAVPLKSLVAAPPEAATPSESPDGPEAVAAPTLADLTDRLVADATVCAGLYRKALDQRSAEGRHLSPQKRDALKALAATFAALERDATPRPSAEEVRAMRVRLMRDNLSASPR